MTAPVSFCCDVFFYQKYAKSSVISKSTLEDFNISCRKYYMEIFIIRGPFMQVIEKLTLPSNLRGRSIHLKVIPTVYNLRNMIEKLILAQGDFSKLKPWEQRSYKAYHINKIKQSVMTATGNARVELLKKHI